MNRIVNYFLQGVVFLVPIVLTGWIFVAVFTTVDGWLGIPVPGAGVLVVVALTTAMGFLASNFLTRRFLAKVEAILDRLPLVKLLHSSMKDLMSAFVGDKKGFHQPVAVELVPGSGIRALGFVTRESLEPLAIGVGDEVAVYLPQAYNFAGQLVLVPRAQVTRLRADSSQIMAFIVSGGVAGVERQETPSQPGRHHSL